MGIVLTDDEKRLLMEKKITLQEIEQRRNIMPVKPVNLNELDQVKQEIRETNLKYKDSIQRNKDLYQELVDNRKAKEELRNKIAELRLKKKKILGEA